MTCQVLDPLRAGIAGTAGIGNVTASPATMFGSEQDRIVFERLRVTWPRELTD